MNNIEIDCITKLNSKDSECDLIESNINTTPNNHNNSNNYNKQENKKIISQRNNNILNNSDLADIELNNCENSNSIDVDIRNMSSKNKRVVSRIVRAVGNPIQHGYVSSGIGKASFIHALIVIFLEFFAWGLLTDQVITVLNETFPDSTFLANGLIHGLKGILSFLSAPLIGAMSDIWGRKVFLLITVFFTCLPIPLMRINTMWYFAMISISGLFAVTFSVVFAYVADVTDESNRTTAYGLVSATFAASLITSPALGSYLSRFYSENFVIALATAIAIFDLFFILVAVPESLPEKLREKSKTISWENVDPFKALKVIFNDRTITLLCVTVFLSYLPEAGQYSCFFVYLKLIVGFTQQEVAYFIAYVGIFSCIAQALVLVILIKYFGSKQSIIIGLTFQVLQLASYGFAAQPWLIWFSGLLAALSSIGYPAISAYISNQSHVDQQGVSQGMVTGIRGLCNGIGPALYGFIFWIFRVNLNETNTHSNSSGETTKLTYAQTHLLPGPPFLFGSILALAAIIVTWAIPSHKSILIGSKHKDKGTTVKLNNSAAVYTRSSSSSMLTVNTKSDKNLLSADMISNSPTGTLMQEKEHLLDDDSNNDISGGSGGGHLSMPSSYQLLSNSDSTTSMSINNMINLNQINSNSNNINNLNVNNNQNNLQDTSLYSLLNSNLYNETGHLISTTSTSNEYSNMINSKSISKISNNLNELNNKVNLSHQNSGPFELTGSTTSGLMHITKQKSLSNETNLLNSNNSNSNSANNSNNNINNTLNTSSSNLASSSTSALKYFNTSTHKTNVD